MPHQIKLNRLFSPIKIGSVELKNRIIMAPIVTRLGSTDWFMTEKEKNYFIRRAEGGRALITVGNATILPHVEPEPRYDGIWDDKFLPTWIDFANVIHDAGSKVSLQLCHVGSQGKPRSYLRDCPDEDKRSTEDGGRYCCNPMSAVRQDYQH
jgi:2,4-dienoyl-CoA reductase-like NADH-dependent reductase (Old Yellow Enzyme family)